MPRMCPRRTVLIACVLVPLSSLAFAAEENVPLNPNTFVSCEYRMAAVFPTPPMFRDITYSNGGMTVPAREFYYENGMDKFSVTIADFTNGPAVDDGIVENAAGAMRLLGDVQDQFPEDYAPGIPGRQLNVFDTSGRQHRVSIYMTDHHLHIAETNAAPGDFAALQFEQSVLVLGPDGQDLNNAPTPPKYPCGK